MPLIPPRQTHWFTFLSLTICGFIAVLYRTPFLDWIRVIFSQDAWVQYLEMKPSGSVAIFVAAHTIAAMIGVPGTFLVLIGGVVFGLVWGTLWSVVGATMGAIAAFCLARYCLREWIETRFANHCTLKTLNRLVHQNDVSCVLAIRFAPISPFSIVNFMFGLTRVRLSAYTIGTFIGIIPGTLAYTWLGVTGHDAWNGEGFLPLAIALGSLALLSAMPLIFQRYQSSKPF